MFEKINGKLKRVIGDKKENKLSREREERCKPVAIEIIKLMSEREMKIGMDITETERKECYGDLSKDILEYMKERNIRFNETAYCFSLVLEAVNHTKIMIQSSLQMSADFCDEKLWGKEFKDVTLKDMDNVLKESLLKKE